MTLKKTEILGPHKRYVIWVQGCNKHCVGCISAESQSLNGGYEIDISDLADDILSVTDIEGITISGGEPFLQSDSLIALINMIKLKRDLGIIIYTGFIYDEIKENPLTALSDIIIDGDYQEKLNDGLSLRGSSNQNICLITQRYSKDINIYGVPGRKVEFHLDSNNKITMAGIPNKRIMKILDN